MIIASTQLRSDDVSLFKIFPSSRSSAGHITNIAGDTSIAFCIDDSSVAKRHPSSV